MLPDVTPAAQLVMGEKYGLFPCPVTLEDEAGRGSHLDAANREIFFSLLARRPSRPGGIEYDLTLKIHLTLHQLGQFPDGDLEKTLA